MANFNNITGDRSKEIMMEYVCCNQCNSNETKDLFSINSSTFGEFQEFRVVQCRKCGLAYLNPRPPEQKILDMYRNEYYDLTNRPDIDDDGKVHFSQSHLAWQKSMLDRIEQYTSKSRICEIGCGYGAFLDLARTR
ncbi:hypothetical protein LCGC14_3168010, partial [marine sediment metagenome]